MQFQGTNPYPEPRVERQNLEYAKLLSQSYAGKTSEDTAVHLYFFQHLTQSETYKEISDILEKISIVEMRHLELLGETIRLLGLEPRFQTYDAEGDGIVPWNSSFVNYATDIKRVLEVNIASESMAIQNYEIQKVIIKDKYIQELLERIIEDEYIHLNIFIELYNKVSKKETR